MPLAPPSFYEAAASILRALGYSLHPVSVNLLVAWMRCEKPPGDTAWQWNNPLNTTLPWPGARDANYAGVKEYPSREDGILATVATMRNGLYPTLLEALRTGDAGLFFSDRGIRQIATWGTNPSCVRAVYANLPPPPGWLVAGSRVWRWAPLVLVGFGAGVLLVRLLIPQRRTVAGTIVGR